MEFIGPLICFTPSFYSGNAKSGFNGTTTNADYSSSTLDNIGLVFTHNSTKNRGLISLSFGFGSNRLADFNKESVAETNSANSSLLDAIVSQGNGYLSNENLNICHNKQSV